MSVVSCLVLVCSVCGAEEFVGIGFVAGNSYPCEHCRKGTATVFEKTREDPSTGTVFANNGAALVGKPCADHKEPILPNWLDLPCGYCFCGRVDDTDTTKIN